MAFVAARHFVLLSQPVIISSATKGNACRCRLLSLSNAARRSAPGCLPLMSAQSARNYAPEGRSDHRPSDFDRKILVWTKTYPALADVPEAVTLSQMKKAKDKFRIRVNIWMGVATLLACVGMIYVGRKAAREGQSLQKENLLWHKEIKAEHEAATAASKS